jgi:ribosomal-protein-alanine N-acetyltransferase
VTRPPRFPELETIRLHLRGLRSGDEGFLASLDSDPAVMAHIHQGALPYDKALDWARVQIELAAYHWHWGKWMVELRGTATPIGWVELGKLSGPDRDDLQVGYELAPAYWGQGYATEAVDRLLEYAFETVDLDRVAAIARPVNTASVRVLDKLGFRRVGRRQDEGRVWCDEYRLTAEEWRQHRAARRG